MAFIIGEEQTRKLIDMPRALELVEEIFRGRALGKVRSLPRRRIAGSSKQLNVMAAWHSDWDLLCLRAYAGPANTISLYSGRTGKLLAVINARYLASLRTGAASGVAAKYLVPPKTQTLGLVGPGWQATFQLEALIHACKVDRVLVFGRSPAKASRFIRAMRKRVPGELLESGSLAEIEEKSDVVVLATNSMSPLLDGDRIKEEVLIISMGANQSVKHEVSGALIQRMDLVVTDDLATAQTDSGDLIDACAAGVLRWGDIVPLEKIVASGAAGNRPRRILFQSNGIADEDLAVGRYVLEQVRRKKIGARRVSEI